MKEKIEQILNLLPEVKWDRWTGEIESSLGICVFGWIEREDGKLDFILLRIDRRGVCMFATSSAKYSGEFCERLGFGDAASHQTCKNVAGYFQGVRTADFHKDREEAFKRQMRSYESQIEERGIPDPYHGFSRR